jgi:hypothetical protein
MVSHVLRSRREVGLSDELGSIAAAQRGVTGLPPLGATREEPVEGAGFEPATADSIPAVAAKKVLDVAAAAIQLGSVLSLALLSATPNLCPRPQGLKNLSLSCL